MTNSHATTPFLSPLTITCLPVEDLISNKTHNTPAHLVMLPLLLDLAIFFTIFCNNITARSVTFLFFANCRAAANRIYISKRAFGETCLTSSFHAHIFNTCWICPDLDRGPIAGFERVLSNRNEVLRPRQVPRGDWPCLLMLQCSLLLLLLLPSFPTSAPLHFFAARVPHL